MIKVVNDLILFLNLLFLKLIFLLVCVLVIFWVFFNNVGINFKVM